MNRLIKILSQQTYLFVVFTIGFISFAAAHSTHAEHMFITDLNHIMNHFDHLFWWSILLVLPFITFVIYTKAIKSKTMEKIKSRDRS